MEKNEYFLNLFNQTTDKNKNDKYRLNLTPQADWDSILQNLAFQRNYPLETSQQDIDSINNESPKKENDILQFDPKKYPSPPKFTSFLESELGTSVIEELTKAKNQAQEKQQREMEAAKKQLEGYLQKQKSLNLMPLALLVDEWTGSNLARGFKEEQDNNKEMALELQKEILKYGQANVNNEADALKDRLMLGLDSDKIKAMLDQNVYEANLKAKAALDNNEIDNETKKKLAEDARITQERRDKFLAQEAYKRKLLEAGYRKDSADRAEKQYNLSVADKVGSNAQYKSVPIRLKMLDILERYDRATDGLDERRLAAFPTWDAKLAAKQTEIERIYGEFTSMQKEVDALGALTNSDIGLVWRQMPDATSELYAGKKSLSGGGLSGIKNSILQAKKRLLNDHEISMNDLKNNYQDVPDAIKIIDRQDKEAAKKLKQSLYGNVKIDSAQPEFTKVKTNEEIERSKKEKLDEIERLKKQKQLLKQASGEK